LFRSILSHTLFELIQDRTNNSNSFVNTVSILIGEANKPKTVSVGGVLDLKPNRFLVILITREVNNAGYRILVQHTFFLFQEFPFYTTNVVAPSTLLAEPGGQK
jgi:hypothetical protein